MNTNIINFLITSALDRPLDKFDKMDLAATGLSPIDMQVLASNDSIKLRDHVIGLGEESKTFNAADFVLVPHNNKTFSAANCLLSPHTSD